MTNKPAPSTALDPSGGTVERGLKILEGAECAFEGGFERAFRDNAACTMPLGGGGSQVLPEKRMVDVTCSGRRFFEFGVIDLISIRYGWITRASGWGGVGGYVGAMGRGYAPPPLNLSAAWRAMRSLGVDVLA